MNQTSRGIHMPYLPDAPSRRRRAMRAFGSVAIVAAAVLAACEGENLFRVGTTVGGGAPQIVDLLVPAATLSPGDPLDMTVVASALGSIDELHISLRNAVVKDSVVEVDPPRQQVTQDVLFIVPAVLADSIIVVRARARTDAGQLSEMVIDTVRVNVPVAPAVSPSR